MRTIFLILLLTLQWIKPLYGQVRTLRIEECYEAALQNYPLIKQKELLLQSNDYTIANARSGFLPQLTINGQATYQSAVTEVPNQPFEPLTKDQYKIYGEVNQAIYDGGGIKRQASLLDMSNQVENQKLEIELYKIRDRINQLYFGILLIEAQLEQVSLLKRDLQSGIDETESAIRNGVALRSTGNVFRAEYLKAVQQTVELESSRKAYLLMLGVFMNERLDEQFTDLLKPDVYILPEETQITRPELSLYRFQSELVGSQYMLNNVRNLPKLNLFLQGGYGKPGLNFLLNEFDLYYIGGVRLNWSLGGYYNQKRDRGLRDVNLQMINAQKETFLFNTNLSVLQVKQEIEKIKSLIEIDRELIELRSSIKSTSRFQQENGVITEHDYLLDLHAEDQAKQNLLLHEVQLMMAYYNYKTLSGL
ncbi:MAG: TolC family protein [Flammeovirgaceae bacterium]|nr:TolC family protein [Flammeovirgaceae bacterium]